MIQAIVCGYRCDNTLDRCLQSIEMQTVPHKTTVYIDRDYDRKYLLGSTIQCINRAAPADTDIIATVDADDFLCDEMAFAMVEEQYKLGALLTHGSYINMHTQKRGKFCGAYEPGENIRASHWRGSHLKTFRYDLFKKIPRAELLDEDGEYYKCCADRALMIPMMELAGLDRIAYIKMLIYAYDDTNPLGVWRTMRDESVRIRNRIAAREPLARDGA